MNWGDWNWVPGIKLTGAEATSVEVLGIAATVAAAGLAAYAIRQSGKQGREALDAIRRERRLDFELDALKELHLAVRGDSTRTAILMLDLLPPDELPTCRERYDHGLPSFGSGAEERQYRDRMEGEVRTAIQSRIDQRD